MEVLDGDDVRLSSRGKYAERDIVQVCQHKHISDHLSEHKTGLIFTT